MTRDKTKKDLLEAMKQEGLIGSIESGYRNFILKYEREGQFKPKRNPLNDYRIFSQSDIDEIIKRVKENGRDFEWRYDE